MDSKLVSVIIPAYNAEEHLKETLDSLIRQRFKDFEIIIIDDGSEDGTWEIIKYYQEKYPKIICAYQQENCGQSATRNRALKYVKGKYIAFVDADDIVDRDYLKTLYDACVQESADIAVGGYKKFESDSKKIIYTRNAKNWNVDFGNEIHHVFQYSPWGKLFSTKFIMEHGFVFSEGEQLEDGPYGVMTHILADKVAVLDSYGYKYRVHEKSTMGNVRKKKARPRVPYRGIEQAILKVREYKKDQETERVLEYCIIKILAGLTTSMYKSCDSYTRKKYAGIVIG